MCGSVACGCGDWSDKLDIIDMGETRLGDTPVDEWLCDPHAEPGGDSERGGEIGRNGPSGERDNRFVDRRPSEPSARSPDSL